MRSTGMLAAEAERLQAERSRLEAEIQALAGGLPDGARDVVERAENILRDYNERLAALREARDAIDAKFQVSRRRADEQRARERAEREASLRQALVDAEEARIAAVEKAETAWRAAVAATNEAIAAHTRVNQAAAEITQGQRVSGTEGLSTAEFIDRLAWRITALLRTLSIPGALPGGVNRIGRSLTLPASSLYAADEAWTAREASIVGPAVRTLINSVREG